MQNRTPIAAEARQPLSEFEPVPRKCRRDAQGGGGGRGGG
jgi:hypothetical protein